MTHRSRKHRALAITATACLVSLFALPAEAQTTNVEAGIDSSTNTNINVTQGINAAAGDASPLAGTTTTSGTTAAASTAPGSASTGSEACASSNTITEGCALGSGTPLNAMSTPPEAQYPLYPWEDGIPPGE